jgi:hypothetical protein
MPAHPKSSTLKTWYLTKGVLQGKHTGDGAVDDSAVLELDSHRLVVQLHQEPAQEATPRPNPGGNCTKQISERKRIIEGKRVRAESACLPDELHLGCVRWKRRKRR